MQHLMMVLKYYGRNPAYIRQSLNSEMRGQIVEESRNPA